MRCSADSGRGGGGGRRRRVTQGGHDGVLGQPGDVGDAATEAAGQEQGEEGGQEGLPWHVVGLPRRACRRVHGERRPQVRRRPQQSVLKELCEGPPLLAAPRGRWGARVPGRRGGGGACLRVAEVRQRRLHGLHLCIGQAHTPHEQLAAGKVEDGRGSRRRRLPFACGGGGGGGGGGVGHCVVELAGALEDGGVEAVDYAGVLAGLGALPRAEADAAAGRRLARIALLRRGGSGGGESRREQDARGVGDDEGDV